MVFNTLSVRLRESLRCRHLLLCTVYRSANNSSNAAGKNPLANPNHVVMKNLYTALFCSLLICIVTVFPVAKLIAQDTTVYQYKDSSTGRSSIFAGTQIPLQFTVGYEYRLSKVLSARAQAGFVGQPYSGFIVDAMEAFGMDKYLSQVIRKSFEGGVVIGAGPNFHFGKNYIGVFGQYMRLKTGGITPADALSIQFKKDFSQFDVTGLPVFVFNMQSSMFNTGLLYGRQFTLRNPRFAINAEAGIAKVVASKNNFSSNRSLIDRTRFATNLYRELDEEIRSAYWKHGFIPTLNLYFVYHL